MSLLPLVGRRSLDLARRLTTRGASSILSPVGMVLAQSLDVLACRPFSVSFRSNDKPKDLKDFNDKPKELMNFNDKPSDLIDFRGKLVRLAVKRTQERYINQHFDASFTLEEFERGAKQALIVVSDVLASDDVTPLLTMGLVEPTAFAEIQANHTKMDATQRRKFRVKEILKPDEAGVKIFEADADIILGRLPQHEIRTTWSYLRRIQIIEDGETGSKAAEITMTFFVDSDSVLAMLGLMNIDHRRGDPILKFVFDELQYSTMTCHYRFYRDFNDDRGWILNAINQYPGGWWVPYDLL